MKMDLDWSNPLDEFTLRFLVKRLTDDREAYIRMAREVKGLEDAAGEAFMIRAEECGRIIHQLNRQLERMVSLPPPEPPPRDPRKKTW